MTQSQRYFIQVAGPCAAIAALVLVLGEKLAPLAIVIPVGLVIGYTGAWIGRRRAIRITGEKPEDGPPRW